MDTKNDAAKTAVKQFMADYKFQPGEEGKVLTIRVGDAPKLLDEVKPNNVRLSGVISAPSAFYNKRKHLHNKDECHVIFDKSAGTIKLVVNETVTLSNYEVTGTVIKNPDLDDFGINEQKVFSVKELMQVLKFNRVHFVDKDDNAKIVASLQNFKAVVEKTIEDHNDQRGNENKQKIQKLETGLKENFVLAMPLYKGGDTKTFTVDILCQITDGGIVVWLESRDLKELGVNSMNAIIDSELKNFEEIVCIEK